MLNQEQNMQSCVLDINDSDKKLFFKQVKEGLSIQLNCANP